MRYKSYEEYMGTWEPDRYLSYQDYADMLESDRVFYGILKDLDSKEDIDTRYLMDVLETFAVQENIELMFKNLFNAEEYFTSLYEEYV